MKKTAVEWFAKQLDENKDKTYKQLESIFEQAKEMEREQMKYFIQVGYYAHSQGHTKDDELYNYWIYNYNRE
jgi:hypothetical protein